MYVELLTAVIPVFLVAGVGYALRRLSGSDLRGLHLLAYYVAGPAMVFTALFHADLSGDSIGRIAAFTALAYVVLWGVGWAAGFMSNWPAEKRRAAALSLGSTNCANYGLPIIGFAFGEAGVVIGTVFVVMHIVVHVGLGGTYASWLTDTRIGTQLKRIFSIPYIYAAGLGLGLRAIVGEIPVPIAESLDLLGRMWIPLLILLLGAEMASISSLRQIREALVLTGLKLLIAPAAGLLLAALLGLTGLERSVLILQASMPTAVNGLLFARQFETRPDLVATVLLLTTLGSLAVLPLLLSVVR